MPRTFYMLQLGTEAPVVSGTRTQTPVVSVSVLRRYKAKLPHTSPSNINFPSYQALVNVIRHRQTRKVFDARELIPTSVSIGYYVPYPIPYLAPE